jgi:hypothetical protein
MDVTNPTLIRLGMVGAFFGKRYRVAGRVIIEMTEGGEKRYWNEFNLVDPDSEPATLVFEVIDDRPEWRLFTIFEPKDPLSAEDAASKRVGDQMNLEGTEVRVTLVSESRICHIEGEGAEGEEVGDIAHYFNAQDDNIKIVVSWKGEEVEFFRGVNISYATVKTSFNLHADMPGGFGELLGSTDSRDSSGTWFKFTAVLMALVVIFVSYSLWRRKEKPKGVMTFTAPASPLKVGSTGLLNGKSYRLREHKMVEFAQVGLRSERHEYQLTDAEGNQALLVYGWKPGAKDWVLLSRLQPLTPLTPQEAATERMGGTVKVDGYEVRIIGLFRETVRLTESAESADSLTGTVLYGFIGQTGSTVMLVRWRESDIAFYAGKSVPPKEVAIAFGLNK